MKNGKIEKRREGVQFLAKESGGEIGSWKWKSDHIERCSDEGNEDEKSFQTLIE